MLAEELAVDGVIVNSVCPGWTRTAMGGERAPRTIEEGAASVVQVALEPQRTGEFLRDGHRLPW